MSPLIQQLNTMGLEDLSFPMPNLLSKKLRQSSLILSTLKALRRGSRAVWDWLVQQNEEATEVHNRIVELSRQDTRNPYNSFYIRNRTF